MSTSNADLFLQAFPVLTTEQIALLRPFGTQRATRVGDVIFEVGSGPLVLVVLLAGRLEIVDPTDGAEHLIKEVTVGEFAGDLALLTGQPPFANCVVREPGDVLVVPAAGVQEVVATLPEISDLLVTAFAARRQLLMRATNASLTFIATESAPGLLPLTEFVDRHRIPYRWLAPDDPLAVALLNRVGALGPADIWVVVRGQTALADPSLIAVAKALGLDLAFGQEHPVDLVVVGTGPAGLAAAVYGASEGLSTIAIDDVAIGGQAGASSRIENYLGFPAGISGGDLAFRAEVQALKFGARISVPRRATNLRRAGDHFEIELDQYQHKALRARSVVIATGARYRRLGLPDQARFEGAGIYYAATELEARRCHDTEVVVVGGGNSAGQAAMFLAATARCVHLVHRGPDLDQSMSQYLTTRLQHTSNVRLHLNGAVRELQGDGLLRSVTIATDQGAAEAIPTSALFVMIGADPRTDWLRGTLALDDSGFVLTGPDAVDSGTMPLLSPFQTSQPGIFAVGDVRSGSVKRVASAVGEGSVVVQAIHRYLALTPGAARI